MKEIVLSDFVKTGDAWGSQPYAIYFVYCEDGQNFCVKGMSSAVLKYVESNFKRAIYYYSFWAEGRSRGGWGSTTKISFRQISQNPDNYKSRKSHQVIVWTKDGMETFTFRRIPRKWLPEYSFAK